MERRIEKKDREEYGKKDGKKDDKRGKWKEEQKGRKKETALEPTNVTWKGRLTGQLQSASVILITAFYSFIQLLITAFYYSFQLQRALKI